MNYEQMMIEHFEQGCNEFIKDIDSFFDIRYATHADYMEVVTAAIRVLTTHPQFAYQINVLLTEAICEGRKLSD